MAKDIKKFILKTCVRKLHQPDVNDFIMRLEFSQLIIDFISVS